MLSLYNIKYKDVSLDIDGLDEETAEELLLDQIISESVIPVSKEETEKELYLETAGFLQRMRYQAMGGDHQLEEIDFEEWKEEMRRQIIRDFQIDIILSDIIEKEKLTVTMEELEEAAIRIAEKEDTTLEMVRRFMGEDYSLLKKDVLRKKARRYLVYREKQKKTAP